MEPIMNSRNTPGWTLGSILGTPRTRPRRRGPSRATSAFARMDAVVLDRVVAEITHDIDNGVWDSRNGHLHALPEYDVGMRLLIAHPSQQ